MRSAAWALALAACLPTGAAAQTAQSMETANASTSAVVIEGSAASDTLRTHPDVMAPSLGVGQGVCRYGVSGGVGSLLFGGVSGGSYALDEGCEARADSAHFANLAVTAHNLGMRADFAASLMQRAAARLYQSRADMLAQAAEAWPVLWRP